MAQPNVDHAAQAHYQIALAIADRIPLITQIDQEARTGYYRKDEELLEFIGFVVVALEGDDGKSASSLNLSMWLINLSSVGINAELIEEIYVSKQHGEELTIITLQNGGRNPINSTAEFQTALDENRAMISAKYVDAGVKSAALAVNVAKIRIATSLGVNWARVEAEDEFRRRH